MSSPIAWISFWTSASSPSSPSLSPAAVNLARRRLTILVGCQSPPTWPNSSARSEVFVVSVSSSTDETATPCAQSARTMREIRVR